MKKFFIYPKLILTLALLLAGVVFWAWILFALAGATLRAGNDISQIENEIKDLEGKQAAARAAAKILDERQADLVRIKSFFPERKQPLELIERLEDAARQTGNKVALALPGSEKEEGPLIFRLTVEGSVASTGRYLDALGLLPYDIAVRDLAFQKVSESQRQGNRPDVPFGSHRLVLLIEVATR